MIDGNHVLYAIDEIKRHKNKPYSMNNEELADELLPFIWSEFPEAQLIKYDGSQYIIVTQKAKTVLVKWLREMQEKHKKAIAALEISIVQANSTFVDGMKKMVEQELGYSISENTYLTAKKAAQNKQRMMIDSYGDYGGHRLKDSYLISLIAEAVKIIHRQEATITVTRNVLRMEKEHSAQQERPLQANPL